MSAANTDTFYPLLPAVHRVRDADRGEPLHALLRVIDAEFGRIHDDIAGLYDNWFIETCDEWVVPYIGDLLGVRPIRSITTAGISLRGYVANTLAYRRRKGTALVLEQLARDVTGWPAHAVEFFQRLATTQHMNHVRFAPAGLPDIRNASAAQLAGTAFGEFAHVPEMRRIVMRGGRYNVPNIGLFLWRLQSYTIGRRTVGVDAADFGSARRIASSEPNTFTFHPAGVETPLFNEPVAEEDINHLAGEENVPAPLRELALAKELAAVRNDTRVDLHLMSAEAPALRIFVRVSGMPDLIEVPRERIYLCSIPPELELNSPLILAAAIDTEHGRLRFPAAFDILEARACYAYGFPGDLGGGPYDRAESIHAANGTIDTEADSTRSGFFAPTWQAGVSHLGATGTTDAPVFGSLREAIEKWNERGPDETGVIVMMDSMTDDSLSATSPSVPLEILVPPGSRLLLTAAQWPRDAESLRHPGVFTPSAVRSHVRGNIVVRGAGAGDPTNAGMLVLNGLLLEDSIEVADGNLATLVIQHCTVLPGVGRVHVAAGNPRLRISIERSILGAIDLVPPLQELAVTDSMIESAALSPPIALSAPQTPCSLRSCTIAGRTHVQSLEASDCIFTGEVEVTRRQAGCVRFSFVPEGSTTPRRYRCQPDLAIESATADLSLSDAQRAALRATVLARVKPAFESLRFGAADYGQLDTRCAIEIREGAEQSTEMGMYRFLQQPHREANLRTVLQEYLRFGLQAGLFFVT